MNTGPSRNLPRLLTVLALAIASWAPGPVCAQEYDPAAETQRLIAKASADLAKDKEVLAKVEADMKAVSKEFGEYNRMEEELNSIVAKCDMLDVNNRFKLILQLDVAIVTHVFVSKQKIAHGLAKAAGEFIKEAAKELVTEEATKYINEHWPGIWRDGNRRNVGQAIESSVRAVQEFNVALKMNYVAVETYVRRENAELAAKEGPLNGNLLILKHSQIIREKGTIAVNTLERLKAERLEQYKILAALKGTLEDEIRRLEADIRSWNRSLEIDGIYAKANKPSEGPVTLTFPTNVSYEFGEAASRMKEGWSKLETGQYNCGSYENNLWSAYAGAQSRKSELIGPYYQRAAAACAANGNACAAAYAAAAAAATRIEQAFDSSVGAANKEQNQKSKDIANGPLARFGSERKRWEELELDAVVWGEPMKLKMEGQHGDWLASAIWQYALARNAGSAIASRAYPMSARRIAESDTLFKTWLEDAQAVKDYYTRMQSFARNAANIGSGYASVADGLGNMLKPNIELWDCFRSRASSYNPALGNINSFRYEFDRLSHFLEAFRAVDKGGQDAGQQLSELAEKSLQDTTKLVEAFRSARSAREQADALVAASKALQPMRESGNLDVSGGRIPTYLSNYDINEPGLQALEQRIQKLTTPELLEAEALTQIPGMPGYSYKNVVLDQNGVQNLKESVKRMLAAIGTARDNYQTAYGELAKAEARLDATLATLRERFAPLFPEEVPYLLKDAVLAEYTEPEALLPLRLRFTIPPPQELPDSGLGSGALIERYAQLAERYHRLVDPHLPAARAARFAPSMEELYRKLQGESGKMLAMGPGPFRDASNRYSEQAYRLYQQANSEGNVLPKSRVATAYNLIIGMLSNIASTFYARERLANAEASLQGAIEGIRNFLGSPEQLGGPAMAQQWMDSIPATKNALEESVRSNATIQGLVKQLEAFLPALREAVYKVDPNTLARDTQAIQGMYQDFVSAYQGKNLPGLLRFLAPEWRTADGSDIRDMEDILRNSFRVFDEIVFKISNIRIQRVDAVYQVSYRSSLTGKSRRMQKNHNEESDVVDTVQMTSEGPRIVKTSGLLH